MSNEPLQGNPYAAEAQRYAIEAGNINEWDSKNRPVWATLAVAYAQLAAAYETRRAHAATLGAPLIEVDPGRCAAEYLDAFKFITECQLPAGHDGPHSEAKK